ncbi:MAG: hypothetical protein E7015_04285 [Alphaproteobacteria bacterium]|nr:hypothetical protein [Alphaproteobacteria bacterium]
MLFVGDQSHIDEIYKTIYDAHDFDDEQFVAIEKQFSGENKQRALAEILQQELRSIGGLEESLISQIVFSSDRVVFKATLLELLRK